MKRLITALGLLGLSLPAVAARMPMEPQNRAHFGASIVDLDAIGISAGLDSRLTRFMYVDVGGFASASAQDLAVPTSDDAGISDYVKTRHSLWVAPGFRIPHRYGDGLRWDLFLRGGFGVVWSQDLSNEGNYLTNPAGLGGADFMLQKGKVGARVSGKVFAYRAFPNVAFYEKWGASELGVISNQITVEAIYQW